MKSYSKIYHDTALEYRAGRNGKPKDYKKAIEYLEMSIQEEKTKDNLAEMGKFFCLVNPKLRCGLSVRAYSFCLDL